MNCPCVFAQEEEDEQLKLAESFQELFLGEIVYPQDRGELQVTTGFLWAHEGKDDFALPVLLEYGITDYLQIGTEFAVEFLRTEPEPLEGIGNINLESYYNFYNDPDSGRAYGVGLGVGSPTLTREVGPRAVIYEPFFVAYQEFDPFFVNGFIGVEVEHAVAGDEETEVAGEIGLAVFRQIGPFVSILELGIEIEEDEAAVRLAPAAYWQPPNWTDSEVGVSLPIGLTGDAPDLGVFLIMTREFGGD